MASIRRLPSGNWNVQIRFKGKIFATQTLKTRPAAEQWAKKKEKELNLKHPYFLDAGHAYCHVMLNGKPSQKSSSYRVERIARYDVMAKTMDKITLQDVNSYKQTRLEEVKPTTCRDELQMIRRVFRWYSREYLARTGVHLNNPCDLIKIPRASKPRDRVVSRDELKLLISAMTPQMAVFTELAYETAMRRGELVKLKPEDLFLDQRFLRVVDGKEGSRDVPLTTRAVELLEWALNNREGDAELFQIKPLSLSQAVRRARQAVGLDDDVRLHQLRHSRITEVARKGLNQAQIMMVSGHRDIRSVQRYTHLRVRDVIDLID